MIAIAMYLEHAPRKLHAVQLQLLGSRNQAPEVLPPVQAHPQLLQGPCKALACMQSLAAWHVCWPSQHLALYC